MADVQILATGVQDAPLDYIVQPGQEITLKSLYASFDGSAATAAYLPAVQVISDSGHVVGTYVTQSSVAAGGSADVSFGPFLRGAASSTPSTAATDFGSSSWESPLWNFHGAADILSSASVDWVYDAAASSGGYVTRATPLQNSFFALILALHPQSAIYGFTFTFYGGVDYGIISVDIASLLYQSSLRGSGNEAGKIQDVFRSGTSILANYGSNPTFLNLVTLDAYSAVAIGESNYNGTITFIPGGAEGDPLTTLSAATDPYTGLSISDGGPGWYCLRFQVKTKNGASAGYRFRVPRVGILRVPDGDGF